MCVAILLRVPEVLAWSVHFFGGRCVVWVSYTSIALDEDEDGEEEEPTPPDQNEAWRLFQPLLLKYMLPLCRHLFLVLRNWLI